ncbi:hypothetical protein [Nostoc sp. FACHB-190]|uniref:hypothetical protein n=1 Tax=Nostoc sp. FACHB-190 TaxID=2692838 RepID=UPI0016838909|nr:hypothetical protein [Nostoc sp. FACHB-190]MBD2302233.1 hypothetical protein [Nostoc sp. FACHB-190]
MANVERESINFKLPKVLANALRKAARERKTTATDLVIQGLHQILGDVPGTEVSVEIRLYQLEEEFFRFQESVRESSNDQQEKRLTNLEGKLEELAHKLSRFEGALIQMHNSINTSRSRNKSGGYSYQTSAPVKLQPHNAEDLAKRFGTTASTIEEKRATSSQKDFERWTQDRDFIHRSWRFNEKDGLYYPMD